MLLNSTPDARRSSIMIVVHVESECMQLLYLSWEVTCTRQYENYENYENYDGIDSTCVQLRQSLTIVKFNSKKKSLNIDANLKIKQKLSTAP